MRSTTRLAAVLTAAALLATPGAAHAQAPQNTGASASTVIPTPPAQAPDSLQVVEDAMRRHQEATLQVSQALRAANMAAAAAAKAGRRAAQARQGAARTELFASALDMQAAQAKAAVEGVAHQMADTTQGQSLALVGLIVAGVKPADAIAGAEQAGSAATALSDALDDLAHRSAAARAARTVAAGREARAQAAQAAATKAASRASRVLLVARSQLRESRKALTLLAGPALGSTAAGCTITSDVTVYPNGMLPDSVLCPLASAPGQRLRTDAARAYDRLSMAYARHFGTPMCITDSYRPLSVQIDLKRRKPFLAAVPGTSNHGWGVAVDLCGGIESFGTPQHDWLFANGPVFGWFHPDWAEPTGSKPEPWHWEFSPELAAQMTRLLAPAAGVPATHRH